MNRNNTPRIYVACLASYNSGELHGEWIDADQDPADILAEVRAMLNASPEDGAEEWAIHDHDNFEGVELSEWESFDRVSQLAAFVSEHGRLGAEVLAHCDNDLDEARTALDDNYRGEYESLAAFARELTEETTQDIPESVAGYIDYEAMGRDMALSGDVFTVETGFEELHVFWSR